MLQCYCHCKCSVGWKSPARFSEVTYFFSTKTSRNILRGDSSMKRISSASRQKKLWARKERNFRVVSAGQGRVMAAPCWSSVTCTHSVPDCLLSYLTGCVVLRLESRTNLRVVLYIAALFTGLNTVWASNTSFVCFVCHSGCVQGRQTQTHGGRRGRTATDMLGRSYSVWTGGKPGWRFVSSTWAGTGSGSHRTRCFGCGARTVAAACLASPSTVRVSALHRPSAGGEDSGSLGKVIYGRACSLWMFREAPSPENMRWPQTSGRVADSRSARDVFLTDSGFWPEARRAASRDCQKTDDR